MLSASKMILTDYLYEIKYLRLYLIVICMSIFSSYSLYAILDNDIISRLGEEDNFFEWLTAVFCLFSAILFLLNYVKSKNFFFLILFFLLFIGFGEEISWGQRILNFDTPEKIKEVNLQGEFTIHNLELFSSTDLQGNRKDIWNRVYSINLLFRIFSMLFGIILPFCIYHFKFCSKIGNKVKIPIPPISIGIFFIINWLIFRILLSFVLPKWQEAQYYDTVGEIFECLGIFIILIISIYFFNHREANILGKDIKEVLFCKNKD
jgi:hypothetical protein